MLSMTLTCGLDILSCTEVLAVHQDAPQGEGLSLPGFQTWSLKCGKAWKTGQRVRQEIVMFPLPETLKELKHANHCASGDLQIFRVLCSVHQFYH